MANTNNNGMKKTEVLRTLKDEAMSLLSPILTEHDAIRTGDYTYVVESSSLPGKYYQVAVTAKDVITNDDGKRVPYDPFIEVDRYEMEQEEKRVKAEERKRKHDETVKRAEERRAKAKANAEAKKAAKAKTGGDVIADMIAHYEGKTE